MLHKIAFENFYSFLEKAEVNLVVNNRTPDTDAYTTTESGVKVSKLMAFVGPNASGKTNLLKCIVFMDWFIRVSFRDSTPDEQIPFKPFLFHSESRPSSFLLDFEDNGKIYSYEVTMTQKRVLSEKLFGKSKGKRLRKLFSRTWDNKKGAYKLDLVNFKLPAGFAKLIRQNASIISTASQVRHEESIRICQYFDKLWTNINEAGKVPPDLQREVLEFYSKNPKLRQKAEEILGKFDLGLFKIKIDKFEGQEKKSIYRVFGAHKFIDDNQKETLLPFSYESAGTRNLLSLLRLILGVLNDGGVAIIDEMEHDLHPLMISEIVNLFTSANYNPKNAQLLFSTHTAQILNKLDKPQIIFVEKNESLSQAWPLSSIKGVKADDNFYAKYMAGAYGGIPRL